MIKEMFSSLLWGPKYRGKASLKGRRPNVSKFGLHMSNHWSVTGWSWISDILLHFETAAAQSRASS